MLCFWMCAEIITPIIVIPEKFWLRSILQTIDQPWGGLKKCWNRIVWTMIFIISFWSNTCVMSCLLTSGEECFSVNNDHYKLLSLPKIFALLMSNLALIETTQAQTYHVLFLQEVFFAAKMNILEIIAIQNCNINCILQIFWDVVHRIRKRRLLCHRHDESDMDIFIIINFFCQNIHHWFNMVQCFIKYFKHKSRIRRLYKPHLLIHIIAGYR